MDKGKWIRGKEKGKSGNGKGHGKGKRKRERNMDISSKMRSLELPAERVRSQLDSLRSPLEAYYSYLDSNGVVAELHDDAVLELSDVEVEHEPEVQVGNPWYMVNTTKKRGSISIHLCQGRCYRRAGRELLNVSYCDELEDNDLSLRCRDCFRDNRVLTRGAPTMSSLADRAEEEDSTGDESSSTNPDLED
jgi:hypothetical protein